MINFIELAAGSTVGHAQITYKGREDTHAIMLASIVKENHLERYCSDIEPPLAGRPDS
jgi:hypothetical protein